MPAPGHWNDPDMLEVGNKGLTLAESRAHFSLWCMLAAPADRGQRRAQHGAGDPRILTNKDVIAIDQDPLGHEGFRFRVDPDKEIWAKELSNKEWAVCVLNTGPPRPGSRSTCTTSRSSPSSTTTSRTSGRLRAPARRIDPHSAVVDSHDVMLFRLKPGS